MSSRRPPRALMPACLFVPACLLMAASAPAAPVPLAVSGGSQTARTLAQALAGCGITIMDARMLGPSGSFGTFSHGLLILGFDSGIVMSTGAVTAAAGPNRGDDTGAILGGSGDDALTALAGQSTFDAAILEFDFIPSSTTVTFDYVFGSDEYNEWVDNGYNDVFAFWLNGTNVALVPGTALPVTIDNVNNGRPIGAGTISNSVYYLDNAIGTATVYDPVGSATRFAGCELDGLTLVFTVTATVRPNVVNRMRFAIADAGDARYDSAVFIRAGSLASACGGSVSATTSASSSASGPLLAVPNPFRPGTGGAFGGGAMAFRPVPAGTRVRIYTTAGTLVRSLEESGGTGSVSWDAKNEEGKPVASGVYIAVVEPREGAKSRLKVVVVR